MEYGLIKFEVRFAPCTNIQYLGNDRTLCEEWSLNLQGLHHCILREIKFAYRVLRFPRNFSNALPFLFFPSLSLSFFLFLGSFTVILAAFRFLSKNRLVTIALQNCACLIVYFFNVPLPDTSLSSAVNITFPKQSDCYLNVCTIFHT